MNLLLKCHEQRAANAGLQIFLGHVARLAFKCGGERAFVRVVNLGDRDDVKFDAEIGGQLPGIGDGMFGAEPAGHGDADDFVFSQRRDRQRGSEGGVDSA